MGALHDDVAVEGAAHRVSHRLVVVVAFHQDREHAGDRPLPRARTGTLKQAR